MSTSHADKVRSIQHEVAWGIANMGLPSLIGDACRADQARQRREAAEQIAAQIEVKAAEICDGASTKSAGIALGALAAEGARIARDYANEEG